MWANALLIGKSSKLLQPLPSDIEFRLQPVASLPQAEELWRTLEGGFTKSFFTSWMWIGAWLTSLPQRIQPLLLTASKNGTSVGAAILVARNVRRLGHHIRQLHFNSTGEPELDCIMIEHNDFVGDPHFRQSLWPAFLGWFEGSPHFDELVVPGILQDVLGGGSRVLKKEAVSRAYACLLPPSGDPDAIAAGLSSNSRQHLRRNLRELERMGGVVCARADSVETALAWFELLKRWHIASWTARGKPHAFRSAFFETFHRTLIVNGVPDHSVDLLQISAGTSAIGYLYNFRCADHVMAYQSGFDENLRDKRPGYVSHFLAMQMSTREGAACYDFLAGSNQLKQSFANMDYTVSSVSFARAGIRAYLEGALHLARNAFRHEKGPRSVSAGLSLRRV